jgi:integrase
MAGRAKGEVKVREWKSGRSFALRFWAYGERRYVTLGSERDGWDQRSAEEELENVLVDVRRGVWVPPSRKKNGRREGAGAAGEVPLFGPFARDLVDSRRGQVAKGTTKHEEWTLSHLLPFFGEWALPEIDIEAVDEYRQFKVTEAESRATAIERGRPKRNLHGQILRPLSPRSINRTISFLQWVLSIALEYGYVSHNAAVGRRRRLRERRPAPVHLDTAAQIEALLEAAAGLDRDVRQRCGEREAIVATLVFAGPRAHELCGLRWRDVDLAGGRLFIGRSKTDAGLREIKMLPLLRDLLASHKATAHSAGPEDLVFPSETGATRDPVNLRSRILEPTFKRADELLVSRGLVPLPKGLTTHKLRHTFASVLIACGEDPISLMRQIGHTDPNFTLRVYTHLMSRDPDERARLKALVRGERVIAREAPEPPLLDLEAYEQPILQALAERGGRATRSEIIAALAEAMADRHSARDLESLPSGPPRWQPRVGKVRARLVRRGWLQTGRGRGCDWELTGLGWAKVGREKRGRKATTAVTSDPRRVADGQHASGVH